MYTSQIALDHVHPGHPVSLAVDIMRRYPSLAAATARNTATTELPAALRNAAIPGSSTNLRAALELLEFALQGHEALAVETAAEFWAATTHDLGPDAQTRGADLAKQHEAEFTSRLREWSSHGPR